MLKSAAEIVEDAQRQIDKANEQIQVQIDELVAESERAGSVEGNKASVELLQKLEVFQKSIQTHLKHDLVQASVEVAQSILNDMISNSQNVVSLVKQALGNVHDAQNIVLRVCPSDFDVLTKSQKEFADLSHNGSVVIRADTKVERGGVIIHTDSGVLDAQPSTQLKELKRTIAGLGV